MSGASRSVLALGVAGGLLAGLTGCSIPGLPAAPPASGAPLPASTASAVPSRIVTIVTPKPRTAPPALKNTGTAWPGILASLAGYGQWLLANPDPALVGTIATPGCAMYNLVSRQAAALLRDQAYLSPVAPVFGAVTGPAPAPGAKAAVIGNAVRLDVSASRPVEQVISRGGKQLAVFDPLPQATLQITLYRAADHKWRLCTVNTLGDTADPRDPSVPLF
jgi:hypothetical protein